MGRRMKYRVLQRNIQSSYTLILAARVYNVHTPFKAALCCDCNLFLACVFYPSPFRCFFIFPPNSVGEIMSQTLLFKKVSIDMIIDICLTF